MPAEMREKQAGWSSARPARSPALAAGKNERTGQARVLEPPWAAERRERLSRGGAMDDPAPGGVPYPGFAGGWRRDSQSVRGGQEQDCSGAKRRQSRHVRQKTVVAAAAPAEDSILHCFARAKRNGGIDPIAAGGAPRGGYDPEGDGSSRAAGGGGRFRDTRRKETRRRRASTGRTRSRSRRCCTRDRHSSRCRAAEHRAAELTSHKRAGFRRKLSRLRNPGPH